MTADEGRVSFSDWKITCWTQTYDGPEYVEGYSALLGGNVGLYHELAVIRVSIDTGTEQHCAVSSNCGGVGHEETNRLASQSCRARDNQPLRLGPRLKLTIWLTLYPRWSGRTRYTQASEERYDRAEKMMPDAVSFQLLMAVAGCLGALLAFCMYRVSLVFREHEAAIHKAWQTAKETRRELSELKRRLGIVETVGGATTCDNSQASGRGLLPQH